MEDPRPPLAAFDREGSGGQAIVRKVPSAFVPSMLGSCRAIPTHAHEATGDPTASPALAFDGDASTLWNAGGFAPQAIRARLGGPQDEVAVAALVLVPEMTPNGPTRHVIELDHEHLFTMQASLETSATYVVLFGAPVRSRSVTVRTYRSPSWIAFREITPITCDGDPSLAALPEVPPPSPAPAPAPAEEHVPGAGSCKTAADCAPSDCCHARTCNAIGQAPRCDGIGCSQNVAPNTLDVGACACVKNRCGANIRMTRRPPGR